MNVKKILYNLIESHCFLMELYLRIFNPVKQKGNVIIWSGIRIRNNKIKIEGQKNEIVIGQKCLIQNNGIQIQGFDNQILFGDDIEMNGSGTCTISIVGNNNIIELDSGCKFQKSQFFIQGDNNRIHICENCSGTLVDFHLESDYNEVYVDKMSSLHGRKNRNIEFHLEEGVKIYIGEDCMISNNIQIRPSDSHSIVNDQGVRLNPAKNIKIGAHCWIGMGSMLLKGTEIPANSVVAAGSICTKKYAEQNIILAGNPAKIVKKGINWDRNRL